MEFLQVDNMSTWLQGITLWLIDNGGWLFPLILLVSHFSLRNYVLNKPDGMDVYKSLVSIPIEIKMMSCSFVFAAAITNHTYALAIFVISFAYLFLLAISIGVYNYIDAENIAVIDRKNGTYLFLSFGIAILMLNFSIQLMKFGGVQ
ncbi:hypothetical protein [Microbulbifer agarilyticus]|uniref:hypothetical protein n=1 Tax=Microbulbifer agarilyticus TaxID=260552 RepID=UPI001CD5FA92|nr:hypothetical protein [Microbulbifer agarilyticus]MCA0902029.1 hypothetical protein [Microbulbifer agarilyticus]